MKPDMDLVLLALTMTTITAMVCGTILLYQDREERGRLDIEQMQQLRR